MTDSLTSEAVQLLLAVGLPSDEVQQLAAGHRRPDARTGTLAEFVETGSLRMRQRNLRRDSPSAIRFWELGDGLLRRLPPAARRDSRERQAASVITSALREARSAFLRAHGEAIYAELTDNYRGFVRVEELVYAAAERYPGLTPTRAAVLAEGALLQKEKEGIEIDQGIFLGHLLSRPRPGAHLVHAMLRPKPESLGRREEFERSGLVDLGTALVQRVGNAGYLYARNTKYLNAEDDATAEAMEIGADLILLDPRIQVGVLRGATVEHPRYAGRHVFSAGLNLTHLYQGKISYLFYITRDLGFVNKLYRGLTGPEFRPDEPETTDEKPWIAAVEAFAIGGGCQLLLVMDRVLAEAGSYFNLPARKEGIIPGAANLRLPRVVGDRLARQGILFDRAVSADSPEGRLLCDEVVPVGEMDAAIARAVESLTSSGVVSAAANRKALRVGEEPLAQFQAYMALYAREQAYCHFSPALISNLERHWTGRSRT